VDPSLVTGGIDPGAVTAGPAGVVDARSGGFGLADPVVLPPSSAPSVNVLLGGNHGPMPYLETAQDWAAPKRVAAADRLTFTATNLATVTVDLERARLTCDATLVVTTDGPLQMSLPGCGTTLEFGKGTTTRQISAG
jgi:hypothetical protein